MIRDRVAVVQVGFRSPQFVSDSVFPMILWFCFLPCNRHSQTLSVTAPQATWPFLILKRRNRWWSFPQSSRENSENSHWPNLCPGSIPKSVSVTANTGPQLGELLSWACVPGRERERRVQELGQVRVARSPSLNEKTISQSGITSQHLDVPHLLGIKNSETVSY